MYIFLIYNCRYIFNLQKWHDNFERAGSCSEVTKSFIIIVQIVSYINNNSNNSNAIKILCKKAVVRVQIFFC